MNLPVLLFIYFVRFASRNNVHAVRQFLLRLSLKKFTNQQFRPVHTMHSHGSVEPLSVTSGVITVLQFCDSMIPKLLVVGRNFGIWRPDLVWQSIFLSAP